jgi:hypothetical protein
MVTPSVYFWEGLARMRVGGVSLHNRAAGHAMLFDRLIQHQMVVA